MPRTPAARTRAARAPAARTPTAARVPAPRVSARVSAARAAENGAAHADVDFEARYRVLGSRDRRFDGRFFVAVASTGIYCRPSCPAVVPLRRHVRFYPTAAAAQSAGYRACLRCHPHAVPGSPEWHLRGDLAARAMSLITDGVVDREGVAGLARRLAYSERHLTRQLTAELGAGPLALARAQRAQTARLLIETSGLRLIDVAHAAGFSSVRQFNDTVRAVYGRTPTELRRRAGARPSASRPLASRATVPRASATRPPAPAARATAPRTACASPVLAPAPGGPVPLTVRLAYREPLEWERLVGFLGARAVPGVEEVVGACYRRTLRLPHGCGVVALAPASGHVECHLRLADLRDLTAAVQRCRRLLDLDADPAAPAAHLGGERLLAPLVRAAPGLRVPGAVDGAELAVRAVLGQQVSVAAARTAAGRLVYALGEPLPAGWEAPGPAGVPSTLTHLFPSPAALAAAAPEALPGGPARRRATLRALAQALADGELALDPGADRAAVRARLGALPGVGPWTVEYVAARALCDPDAFPVADLGVRRALERLRGGAACPPAEAARLAERWRPWRAYALVHLWGTLAAT
jgi:AraC family transcriptional regulator of adaptative response / DNA-3-methyladenine glycosylase II